MRLLIVNAYITRPVQRWAHNNGDSQMNTERSIALSKIIDTETAALWDLHKRLGGEYKHTIDQLNDMIKLGERAQAVRDLRVARGVLDRTDRTE